jgi:hypothetical protein
MTRRTAVAIAACIGGAAALATIVLWLASRSDHTLIRWSAIAGVITGGAAVLTLVAALVPLWRRDDGAGTDKTGRQVPGATVTQNIHSDGSGPVNVVGEGSQVNIDLRSPREGQ